MKKLLVIFFIFLGTVYSQDSLTVSTDDWKFFENTYRQTDSSLVECEALNKLYLQRIDVYKLEVYNLKQAIELSDSIDIKENEIINKRQQQVDLLTEELTYKENTIWAYRIGVGGLLAVLIFVL